jgi:hypothetical protein
VTIIVSPCRTHSTIRRTHSGRKSIYQLSSNREEASNRLKLTPYYSVMPIGILDNAEMLTFRRDHCRPISKMFPNAHGYFGPGTTDYCSPGYTADPSSTWEGHFFDPNAQTEKFSEHTGPWQKFGSFKKAKDFFGDGSLWVIQAPGHMPGNLICCCRIQSGEWIVLGSDCAHSRYDPGRS